MIALSNQIQPRDSKHDKFLEMLPRIVRYASGALRGLDPEAREDALAEVVARCFVAWLRLVRLGKEDLVYPTVLALYAIRRFRDGRRVGTKANSQDAYAGHRHGHQVEHIGTPYEQRWKEQLTDDRRTPVPDQAAFRCDFPAWLSTLSDRDRNIALRLGDGERSTDVARKLGVSRGRVSQIRRELCEGWREFCGGSPNSM